MKEYIVLVTEDTFKDNLDWNGSGYTDPRFKKFWEAVEESEDCPGTLGQLLVDDKLFLSDIELKEMLNYAIVLDCWTVDGKHPIQIYKNVDPFGISVWGANIDPFGMLSRED